MNVTVKAFSDYKKFVPADAPSSGWNMEIAAGASIETLLVQLGIPAGKPGVFTVNDSNQSADFVLHPGDVLKIFPMAMGG